MRTQSLSSRLKKMKQKYSRILQMMQTKTRKKSKEQIMIRNSEENFLKEESEERRSQYSPNHSWNLGTISGSKLPGKDYLSLGISMRILRVVRTICLTG